MTNNEGGLDYSTLARPGEVKITRPKLKPTEATRRETLRSELPNQEKFQGDLQDSTHGSIPRQVHGNKVRLPITEQPPLPGLTVTEPKVAVTKRDDTSNLDPELTYIMESIETGEEPIPTTRTKALRFMHAKSDGILKQARKKSKK